MNGRGYQGNQGRGGGRGGRGRGNPNYGGRGTYYNNQTSGQYNPSSFPYSQATGYYTNVTASPGGSMPMGSPQNAVPVQPMNLGPAHGQQNPYMMPQQVGYNMYQNQQRGAYMSPSVPGGYPPRMANGSQNGNMATYSIGSSATTPAASGSSLQKAVREKRVLTITDKDGNPIEIGGSKPASSLNAAASTVAPAPEQKKSEAKTPKTSLLEAAKKAIEEKEAAEKEKVAKDEAEKAAAEEAAKVAAAKALEEEEAARKQKEEEELAKAKKEEEERQKAEAAKKAEAEEEAKAKEEENRLRRSKIFGGGKGGSLSSLAARLDAQTEQKEGETEKKSASNDEKPEIIKEEEKQKVTPKPVEESSPAPATPVTLRPSGGGLRPGGALRPGGSLRPGGASPMAPQTSGSRRVISKEELLRFRDLDICTCRPDDLQDMTVVVDSRRSNNRQGGGGGRGNGGNWGKESLPNNQRRRSSQNGEDQWARNRTPPRGGGGRGGRGRGRGRGGRGRGGYDVDFDGPPPKPLVKSENRWMPIKATDAKAATEKLVKSILNKMTKENFTKLASQMIEIPITSFEVLTTMIYNVYEKALFEPSFGEIYAELCMMLSEKAKDSPFVRIIESDEDPPDGNEGVDKVYRWSNDVSVDDSEIIGPFESIEDVLEAAIDADNCPDPKKRYQEMKLHSVQIYAGQFIKIMTPKDNDEELYTVFFPASKAEEIGQQMSQIFVDENECIKDGSKKNSFRATLLEKCQQEFQKQNIYDDWRKEKEEFDQTKDTLSESERLEKEEDLEFRRIKIKKQTLGNIRFIGELFKIGMLKPRVMRECIENLLNIKQEVDANGKPTGNIIEGDFKEMDEEDHEAVCKLFTTIGSSIDMGKYVTLLDVYFNVIERFSNDKTLNARTRFMYKDLIELRANKWVSRRKEDKVKTLSEIKKDFEREERIKKQQEQQMNQGYRGGNRDNRRGSQSRDNRRNNDNRNDSRGDNRRGSYNNSNMRSNRAPKERFEPKVDSDGFTEVAGGKGASSKYGSTSSKSSNRQSRPDPRNVERSPPPKAKAEPLSEDKLKTRAKTMRNEFMEEGNEEDLIFTMDETLQTNPDDAGRIIVQASIDAIIDCKDAEREAIFSIISILYRNGKLQSDDIGTPFADIIEFVDSFVVDCPNIMTYLGDFMTEFLRIGALDVNYLCDQSMKLQEFSAEFIPQVIGACVKSAVSNLGRDEAKSHFDKGSNKLINLLGADKWNEIASQSGL